MKYLSIDLETTCIDPKCPENIIGLSFIVENTDVRGIPTGQLPNFTCLVKHEVYSGSPYALQMNARFLKMIAMPETSPYRIYSAHAWPSLAEDFLSEHFGSDKIVVAGKNVAHFDIPFLPKNISSKFDFRTIDVGNMFFDWSKDKTLPGMKTCMLRAGYENPKVTHDMYMDAQDNIACLRTTYPDFGEDGE